MQMLQVNYNILYQNVTDLVFVKILREKKHTNKMLRVQGS